MRDIVDIRTCDEHTITIPFMYPVDYINVSESLGTLKAHVVNELRCPDTAAADINMLVYVKGGKDLQYQVPIPSSVPRTISPEIGGYEAGSMSMIEAGRSIGESVASIKSLLLRNSKVWTTNAVVHMDYKIWPYFTTTQKLTAAGQVNASIGGDLFNFLSPMYALMKGSMRFSTVVAFTTPYACLTGPGGNIITSSATNTNSLSRAVVDYSLYANIGTSFYPAPLSAPTFVIPFNHKTSTSLILPLTGDVVNTSQFLTSSGIGFSTGATATALAAYLPSRYVGDDFQLSMFIGCPPVAIGAVF